MKIIDWRDGSHHLLQPKFTRQIPPDPDLYRATDKSDFKISQQALKMPGHHVEALHKPIFEKKFSSCNQTLNFMQYTVHRRPKSVKN